MEDVCQDANAAAVVKSQGELLPPSLVADALVQLVEDKSAVGRVLRVTNQNGIDEQHFKFPVA